MVTKWNIKEKEFVHDFRILKTYWHHCHNPVKETDHTFLVLNSPDWVNVIPITPDNQVVFIRQYRAGTHEITLEIPGGMIEPGEDPSLAGLRELSEETGYVAENSAHMGFVHPNPALMDNHCHFILAKNCQKTAATNFDPAEDIETVLIDLNKVRGMIQSQQITHALVLCAFHKLELLHPEYFS